MLINGLTFGWIYRHVLSNDPRNALMFGGALLLCAAITMIWVRDKQSAAVPVPA